MDRADLAGAFFLGGLTVPYAYCYCANRAWRKVSSWLKQVVIEKAGSC